MSCRTCGFVIAPGATTCPNCRAGVDPSASTPSGDAGTAQGPDPGSPWAGYPGYPPGQPGYAGYPPGYAPGPMPAKSYNLDGLSSALVVMLAISAVASAIGALFEPIVFIMFLLLLPLFVVFPMWFYQARQNAGFLDWRQRWSPPWTVFAWLVPICFLWFPYQIMADIWRAGQSPSERAKFPGLPVAWWACWCLAWFTGYRHITRSTQYSFSSTYTLTFGGTVPSRLFAAAAAALLLVIVKRVSDGAVGHVGKQPVAVGWQPGPQPPGSS